MSDERMTEAEMTEEARRWAKGELPPEGLVEAPEAVPRAKESVAISLRLPLQMVTVLKEFARRAGLGYQVLMKRWLDDRIRAERERMRQEHQRVIYFAAPPVVFQAAAFDARGVNCLPEAAVRDEVGQLAEKVASHE
jgi:hypothetical protein